MKISFIFPESLGMHVPTCHGASPLFYCPDITMIIHIETANFLCLSSFSLPSTVSISTTEQGHMLQQNEDCRFYFKKDMTPQFIVSAVLYDLIAKY